MSNNITHNTLHWVQGNTVNFAIPLQQETQTPQGKVVEDYYPAVDDVVTVFMCGKYLSTQIPCTVDGNVVIANDNGTLKVDVYGVEIRIKKADGTNLRSMWDTQVQIHKTNDGVLTEWDDFVAPDSQSLDAAIFFFAKGDKGDAFTYEDFTQGQIEELKKPAVDAAAELTTEVHELESELTESENQRIANENQRIDNESQRVANEIERVNSETSREQQSASDHTTALADHTTSVADHTTAQSDHTTALSDHTQASSDHVTASGDHTRAESDHALAATDHTTATSDHETAVQDNAQMTELMERAESDHVQVVADHTIAVADHNTATSDHAQAAIDHNAAVSDHSTATSDHATASTDHTTAQSDHAAATNDHNTATTDHQTAVSDHSIADGDHTLASADHTTAVTDHTQAASDHTRAENDNATATSDHTTAVSDHTQAVSDHSIAAADHTTAESDHAAVEVYVDSLGAFDISAYHATGGVLAKYADLTAALGTNGANIPDALRKGGMSVKFVLSSDNKYHQYRLTAEEFSTDVEDWEESGKGDVSKEDLENGNIVPLYAKTLEDWADQKAIATPDTYTDAVRTTGGDIPVEISAGSKPESIKPVAGSRWTAKLLFNGSYNMLNAAKWGAANSQPYVGGVGNDFVYFLIPELTLGTFGTADENNGLLFTDSEGENVEPTSVYFKLLGSTVPQSLTDGTSVTPTSVSYDGKTYKDYATDGAGWLIIPKTYYDNDVCAHIAWEDWYDKYVSLDEPTTNPEAVVGVLMLEGLLALAHSDKYLRGVNDAVCDNVVFGDTSATITHMVDELSVAANAWTNSATGESDSQGNALYRHSATVSLIKQGGAACVEGEDSGIPLTVNGTTVSYIDTNATAPASVVFYEVAATSTTKAYTDSIFNGSNINTETGILPINDCSIEAQVAMDGKANITVKYAKNIVDQVAINATVDVPQIKREVENHEERITDLEDTAVRTGSYDASVAVGLADNFKGDTIVEAEFYKRKTGGTQSVGSGIAAIKEVRGKSIVWNQLVDANTTEVATISGRKYLTKINDVTTIITSNGSPIAINDASVDQVFDLSLMTLSSISITDFEKMFPLAHYDYNAGEVIPFAGQNLTTTGKNQYNPASGKANLLGGQTYQLIGTYTGATIDSVAVTLDSNNCFTTIKDCVLDVTGGNDTDTIVTLYNGETNTFEPYEKHTLPLDPSQWRDKNGNLVFPYGGMHGVGGTRDYAKVDADGYIRKAVRRFGQVDLGDITWTWDYNYNRFVGSNVYSTQSYYNKPKFACSKYIIVQGQGNTLDKALGGYYNDKILVYDSAYTDAATFKSAVRGVMLYYELKTPIEVELATPVYAKYLVDKDGTEEITPANGTTPYTTMANLSILYAMDARGDIKNLPKNYLSKESAENMLNAMVSAGVIASYTMTYDAANGRYAFTIVAPTPEESNE